jgi:hypothetical protein
VLVIVLAASSSSGQSINESVTIEDLGFTRRLHTGARPAALAGAYTAIGDDTHSLIYNPAGLAGVRRIELGIGFQHQRLELGSVFFDAPNNVELTTSSLDYISGAYPVPTYRGSFVLAAGVYRVYSADIDILNRGLNTATATEDDYRLQQSGNIFSYNFGLGVDLSPVISIGGNVFFLDGTVQALTQFSYTLLPPFQDGDFQSRSRVDEREADVDGYGAIIGFQFHPHRWTRFGLSVATPTRVNVAGGASQEDVLYFVNSPDSFSTDAFAIDTDYELPFRASAGASLSILNFLLTGDITYVDWAQVKINGVQLKDSNLKAVFREVWEFRAGLEVNLRPLPIRLRAGYAWLPYPLEYLQPDRIDFKSDVQPASVATERELVSAGAGVLLGRALMLDASAEYVIGAREIPTLFDERKMYRYTLSMAYRF